MFDKVIETSVENRERIECSKKRYEDNGIKYREYRALFYEDH
jgi:hypothetical protein